jgi:hypothetical protein
MRIKQKSVEKAILIGLIAGALVLSPMGGRVVIALAKYYVKKWWEEGGPYIPPENDPNQVRRSIYKLKRNNYINWRFDKNKNTIKLELTEKGRKLFGPMKFDDVSIAPQKNWDKEWRFFMFDIPEKSRSLRDALRKKLKQLGFFRFQQSVWIYPYECERELRYICEFLSATAFTMMFTVGIDNDKILRRYFVKNGILPKKYLDLQAKYFR